MKISEEIKLIQDKIISATPVEQIYLFGSHSNGKATEESDYDFYVVLPDDGVRPVEAVQSIYRSMRGITRKPVDILAGTSETFNRRAKQLTLEQTIATKGVLLYEKPRA